MEKVGLNTFGKSKDFVKKLLVFLHCFCWKCKIKKRFFVEYAY